SFRNLEKYSSISVSLNPESKNFFLTSLNPSSRIDQCERNLRIHLFIMECVFADIEGINDIRYRRVNSSQRHFFDDISSCFFDKGFIHQLFVCVALSYSKLLNDRRRNLLVFLLVLPEKILQNFGVFCNMKHLSFGTER